MTHPDTPLLLLSPLPSIEDSTLFIGDQSQLIERSSASDSVNTEKKDESTSGNDSSVPNPAVGIKREREEIAEKVESEAHREIKKTKRSPKTESKADEETSIVKVFTFVPEKVTWNNKPFSFGTTIVTECHRSPVSISRNRPEVMRDIRCAIVFSLMETILISLS